MSLPASQRRTLDDIERDFQVSAPQLAGKFAIFARLATPDEPISRERIPRSRLAAGIRVAALIPVAIALLAAGLVLGRVAHGSAGCVQVRHTVGDPAATCVIRPAHE